MEKPLIDQDPGSVACEQREGKERGGGKGRL